ncbi:hypothetical protein AB8780_03160 [Enterobacter sp. SAT-E-asb]|uniref:hypothetical protein n=1 Tax=unclassified Enterobacter TaxID=2608935 RepID=UPI00353128BB
MDTLRFYWDTFYTAYGLLFTRILSLILLVWLCHDILRRPGKNAADAAGPIAEADARERYQWRFHLWSLRTVQLLCLLSLFWMLIKGLFA